MLKCGTKECGMLPIESFNKCKSNKHRQGLDHYCRKCRKEQRSKRKKKHYRLPSKNKVIRNGVDGKECPSCCLWKPYSKFWKDESYSDGFHCLCKECKTKINKNYKDNNQECIKKYQKEYHIQNREIKLERSTKWKEDNPERVRKLTRERSKFRRDTEPEFKLKGNLRHRLNLALKNNSKSGTTMALVGCTITELWTHLESQFDSNMTRDNYGEWHVDHIIPCDSFDLSRPEEQLRCFNYRNLQPMWSWDNLSKGNKYKFDVVREIELLNI